MSLNNHCGNSSISYLTSKNKFRKILFRGLVIPPRRSHNGHCFVICFQRFFHLNILCHQLNRFHYYFRVEEKAKKSHQRKLLRSHSLFLVVHNRRSFFKFRYKIIAIPSRRGTITRLLLIMWKHIKQLHRNITWCIVVIDFSLSVWTEAKAAFSIAASCCCSSWSLRAPCKASFRFCLTICSVFFLCRTLCSWFCRL